MIALKSWNQLQNLFKSIFKAKDLGRKNIHPRSKSYSKARFKINHKYQNIEMVL